MQTLAILCLWKTQMGTFKHKMMFICIKIAMETWPPEKLVIIGDSKSYLSGLKWAMQNKVIIFGTF